MRKGVLIRYFQIEIFLHNNWKCESPCVNRRVNVRLFAEFCNFFHKGVLISDLKNTNNNFFAQIISMRIPIC
jgi:hypothetical protein